MIVNLKIKLLQNKLAYVIRNTWYFSVKPLAIVLEKIEAKKCKADEEKLNSVINGMTQEDAVNRLLDVMIRDFAKYPDEEWQIFIAEHDTDDGVDTISRYMRQQRSDKYLQAWAYRLPFGNIAINRALTEKFKDRVLQHGAFKIEILEHQVYCQQYENTVAITLSDEYKKLFSR